MWNRHLPTITVSGPTTFCLGDSVTLTSSNVTGNTWSPGGETTQSITVFVSNTFSVTVDSAGCTATTADEIITVNPLPTPTITASGPTTFCAGDSVIITASGSTGNVWSPGGETTQSITVTSSGSYYVTETDGNGCVNSSSSIVVTVNSLPPTPTITASGPTSFCIGDSVTLTSSSATGNVWSSGETTQSITVNTSGSYDVTVTDGNGCSATSAATTVAVNSLPTADAGPDVNIVAGDSTTLSASGGISYSWSPTTDLSNPNIANPVASPLATTTYTVTITDGNGCTGTDSVTVNVILPPPPVADFTATAITIAMGDSVDFIDLSTNNPTSWSWTFTGGIPSSSTLQNPINIRYDSSGCYEVILIATNVGGTDTATKTCYIDVIVTAPASCGTNATGCPGATTPYTVGTGTATNTTTSYPAPYGNWYWGARHQILYTASELQALGFSGGTLSEIAFNVATINGTTIYNSFEIKMGCTSQTSITTWQTGLTTVFPAQTITITTGWNTHTLTNAYDWDGTSNIIVEVCFNKTNYTNNSATYYTTTGFTSVVYYRADASGLCTNTSITGTSSNRPNIKFTTCQASGGGCPVITVTTTVTDPSCGNSTDGSASAAASSGASSTVMSDDFDPGVDVTMWASYTGTAATSCGSVSGNALYF
ncbi:hypothetical protein JYU20_04375, partial [Bacteroidales bacterium AH-315-I05]|nr:hypothetical protein [Bacteroidales bacterium AH-315-I05]